MKKQIITLPWADVVRGTDEEDQLNFYPDDRFFGSEYVVHLNLHLLSRLYGGPEEGGWWYTRGEMLATVPMLGTFDRRKTGDFYDKAGGRRAFYVDVEQLTRLVDHLCSVYENRYDEDNLQFSLTVFQGKNWPRHKPHYE